ncbi:relaxase/mobilization nuclease domain-containing protein [Rhizobium leguminosarum]|uniref:relaxase/mobilization nuclease domain-containing protein n=1 Tax=Rhizobium leguminosarum TaxID=384 RepID=UPI00161521EB|nr:hypothetical protein [Rhizobium leguminosarum]MBB4326546.1 hypothetical protein [Rhizobium leguminosarum]MBB4352164.1 hypothetical protein [Rhizobium leguminosarum]MBB4546812.1 hypothetical protein [Rhizobium leguminosarum]MBB4559131.1 hypothetical protein [Rhizobium leguminosarum]
MQMIIKGLRIRSKSGISRILRHLTNGDDNESVAFLRGTAADIQDMHKDSIAKGATYSVRHWIIAPHEMMDRPQMRHVLGMLAEEFIFDARRAVVVEHRKKRATEDATDVHWHVLVGEVDPETGRVLKSSFDRVVHEVVARASEYAFGHRFVLGKHTKSVIKGLRKRNLACIADRLENAFSSTIALPAEAFTHAQHQEKKRLGHNLPDLRHEIKDIVARAQSGDDLSRLISALGMVVRQGDKPETWIVADAVDGVLIGALHRLAGARKSEVSALMMAAQRTNAPPEPKNSADPTRMVVPTPQQIETAKPQRAGHDQTASDASILLADLQAMEASATEILKTPVPAFSPSPAMRSTKKAIREQVSELSNSRNLRWDLAEELWNAPSVRWWCYPLGIGRRRQRRIADLEQRIDVADGRIREIAARISAQESRLLSEEKAAKTLFIEKIREVNRKHRLATETLTLVPIARSIIRETPEVTAMGKDHVLGLAKTRLVADFNSQLPSVESPGMRL